ncbi:sodium:proton antiporter [Robiginitomaculum antarcticum]|uniref:sodium:proton antiporter n=1 Tax=Robiginitomaculum antarcticum TaxID=437507 RepID=UPI000371B985|nr:cation:proton antiporter subunit C [Robiginitomaculum antarcticum]
MFSEFITHFNYIVVIILMMTGLYVVFSASNMIKKLVGLSVFQTSVFLLYITMGKVTGGVPPIIEGLHGGDYGPENGAGHGAEAAGQAAEILYSNPLPHVLILTAIVVGVATLAVGLALVVRIREVYGTIEEVEIDRLNYAFNMDGVDEAASGETP